MWQNTGARFIYIAAITEDLKVYVPAFQTSLLIFRDVTESISNRDSSAYTRWTAEDSGFNFQRDARIFLFPTVPRSALGLFEPPTKCLSAIFYPEIKQSGHKTDHSFPSSAEGKMRGAIPPLSHTFSLRGT
jgi:hypothetical protein